jgi:hypothetical protein
MTKEQILLEDNRRRNVIRQIVSGITKVFKIEEDGEFYLPNYFDEEKDFYEFKELPTPLSVEMQLVKNDEIQSFIINGEYLHEDDIIIIRIEYNPEVKMQIMYDLIGELNELIAHEIRHVDQNIKGTYELGGDEPEDPYEYYTQPKELDAQLFGFKRLAKITQKPLDFVIKNWFEKNKEVHRLSDEQIPDVINKILNHR